MVCLSAYVPLVVPDTPVEVIVDLLRKAKDIAAACSTVPEELKSHLQKAADIASGLDDYLEKMTTKESEPLAELYEYNIPSHANVHVIHCPKCVSCKLC